MRICLNTHQDEALVTVIMKKMIFSITNGCLLRLGLLEKFILLKEKGQNTLIQSFQILQYFQLSLWFSYESNYTSKLCEKLVCADPFLHSIDHRVQSDVAHPCETSHFQIKTQPLFLPKIPTKYKPKPKATTPKPTLFGVNYTLHSCIFSKTSLCTNPF